MSPVALGLDGLLAALLLLAIAVGVRLNGRLKTLRDSHAGFATAVGELDAAAARAEAALADLRRAGDETHDSLLARIDTARQLATRLEALNREGQRLADAAPLREQSPPPPRLSAVAPARAPALEPAMTRAPLDLQRERPSAARRAAPEDDLFEAPPPESARSGARR